MAALACAAVAGGGRPDAFADPPGERGRTQPVAAEAPQAAEGLLFEPTRDEVAFEAERVLATGDGVLVERPRAACGPLRLRARWLFVDAEDRDAIAEDVSVSTCDCEDPPWRVDARGARLESDGDLALLGPTLRLGDAPVLWLPYLLVRTGREPGLRPPDLALREGDGMLVGTGAYLPVGPADVDLGARMATAGRVETTAAVALPAARAEATVHRGEARVRARGHTGPLAFEVDRATDPVIVDRLSPTLEEATRSPLRSAAFATFPVGDVASVSSGAAVHGDSVVAPRLVASAGGPIAFGQLLGRVAVLADREAATGIERADAGSGIELRGPLGPLRAGLDLSGRATGWRTPQPAGRGDAARAVAGAGADARLPLERWYGALRHEIAPSIAYRSILAVTGSDAPMVLDDLDRIAPRHRVDGRIDTRLDGVGRSIGRASLLASFSDASFGAAEVALGPAWGAAAWDPDARVATLLEAGVEVAPGAMEMDLGTRRIRPGASPITVEDAGAFRGADPFALARPSDEVFAGVGVRLPLGVRLGGEARYDLVAREPSYEAARLGWTARCACLSVDAVVSHRLPRDLPDAFLVVRASPPGS